LKPGEKSEWWYKQVRRSFKASTDLLTLLAPVTPYSAWCLEDIVGTHSIVNNKRGAGRFHVTLADAFLPDIPRAMDIIRNVMSLPQHNMVRVQEVKFVQTFRDDTESLVILELDFCSPTLQSAIAPLRPYCKLPQYPLHCTIGVVTDPSIMFRLRKKARGVVLGLDASGLEVRKPSPDQATNPYSLSEPAKVLGYNLPHLADAPYQVFQGSESDFSSVFFEFVGAWDY
jgi:hypothetical protein